MEYGKLPRTSVGGLQKCIIPATVWLSMAHTIVASEVMDEHYHGKLMCLCFTWSVYSNWRVYYIIHASVYLAAMSQHVWGTTSGFKPR
jgi:hypothetical protein